MLSKLFLMMVLIFSSALVGAVEPINGSYQKHYNNEKVSNHWLILGAIERIQGAVKPESELRVKGKVQSWLWQIPAGMNSEQAFSQIKNQVDGDASALFDCQGRSCGLSNDYANQVFQQAILFGRDSDQHYWVGLQESDAKNKKDVLWVVYSVQRSNKRVYVYLERIAVDRSQAGIFNDYVSRGNRQTLFQQGYFVLSKLNSHDTATLTSEQITWLKGLLQEYPNKKFALVTHRYNKPDQQGLLDNSSQEAQGLLGQLAEEGAFIKNVYSHGAGAMLPRAGAGARIELVVLDSQ
jgi:hypothetical protein